ncbi:MAG: Flp pilus assembly protein CpaB [Alphaproteobacteria bacterium]|nr:Flp pilus assembly protein CpaB [Alphaproteobacteria bacterium]MCB9699849.1 Flp pilus assembly protein CpaB [Alphaproteobacteria bacterium]
MARSTGGRLRAGFFLALSTVAATAAVGTVYVVLADLQGTLDGIEPDPTVQVLVASHDLGQGRAITPDDLSLVEMPPRYVPDGVMRTSDQAVGRVVRERVLGSEFIREERLADPTGGYGLNAIIPRGMRAVSLDLTDGASVSGFLAPGNYVDVLVTLPDEKEASETVTLLQATTVLAVSTDMGGEEVEARGGKRAPTITVAVTPDQAERVSHAIAQGKVTLTLRGDIDVTHAETHGARASSLLGEDTEERITIRQWKEIVEERGSGELLLIHGRDVKREPAR